MAVVGGLAEVAYGMQLPGVFARLGLEQPIVVPRDSALVMPGRWSGLAAKAGVDDAMVLQPKSAWVDGLVEGAGVPDLASWRQSLRDESERASEALTGVDRSLEGSVKATLAKMESLLDRLGQQSVKAVKRKEAEAMSRLDRLDGWIRPDGAWQERVVNFFLLASEWEQQSDSAAPLGDALAGAFLRGHESADWSPLVHVIRGALR